MRALLLTIVLILASACAPAAQQHTTTTISASVTQPACQVRLPADWVQTLAESRVDTGGYPVAYGPAGEVLAQRGGDLILIQPDKTVSTVYTVRSPADEAPGIAAISDRWIVVGVLRSEGRKLNGDEPFTRIELVDRRDGSVRTVVETPEGDLEGGRNWIDSLAVFDDAVYWITRREKSTGYGTLRSYDGVTGSATEVESADMRSLRATATGLVWTSTQPRLHDVFRSLAPLPDAIASVTGINDDQSSLVRDGDAYAWITGIVEGGTGVARWSPDTGLKRISTLTLFDRSRMDDSARDVRSWSRGLRTQPPLYSSGPYVVVGLDGMGTQSTLIDTRSGAVTPLGREEIGAAGGSIAIEQPDPSGTGRNPPGVVFAQLDRLPPLTCPSTGSTRSTCEVPLPGAWRDALADSVVDTGASTTPLAVGPGGEIAAGYTEDDTSRLLLIDGERSVRTVYRVADPDKEKVGFAAVDARRIVVGVVIRDRLRNGGSYLDDDDVVNGANGGPPTVIRIDVVDRSDDSVRTVWSRTAGEPVIRSRDSLAVFGDTVYWSTAADDTHAVVRSYDLDTGKLAEIASAYIIDDVHATPVGVTWTESDQHPDPAQALQKKQMSRQIAKLPPAVVAAGADPDDATLSTDGTAYAWRTDTGITHWSPDTGVTRIDMVDGPTSVDGPFVVGYETVLDTRSGAIASLGMRVIGTGGGTLATEGRARDVNTDQAGLVRLADLPPLTC